MSARASKSESYSSKVRQQHLAPREVDLSSLVVGECIVGEGLQARRQRSTEIRPASGEGAGVLVLVNVNKLDDATAILRCVRSR